MPRAKTVAALAAPAAAAFVLLGACSLDYEGTQLGERLPERLPDTVATDLVHRVVKDSRTALEVTAARAETYNSQHRTVLDAASFVEYDREGRPIVEGSAGRVVFHTDTEDAEISGRVRVHSAVDEAGIETESLAWKSEPRLLSAPVHDRVVITKDDGSRIEGTGFSGDFRRREIEFSGPIQGTYVWSGDEEGE